MLEDATVIGNGTTSRVSSWDSTGKDKEMWKIPAGNSRVLADIKGPGRITHIWMTQPHHYRQSLLKITWDHASAPSVLCPLGDFFGLGHGLVASYQSPLFSTSTRFPYQFEESCTMNCYLPMPFAERAVVELVNESSEEHVQFFYIDYETCVKFPTSSGYFHAEFRKMNPVPGPEPEIVLYKNGSFPSHQLNKKRPAGKNSYVILERAGSGRYLGCNVSLTNFSDNSWGESDYVIWVDGYKRPLDLNRTGGGDYFGQLYGKQAPAVGPNSSSPIGGGALRNFSLTLSETGGYQTSYVHHLENPVQFNNAIKVAIRYEAGNHFLNEMSSTAYWYLKEPAAAVEPPPVKQRMSLQQRTDFGGKVALSAGKCPVSLPAGQPVAEEELVQARQQNHR